VDVVPFAPESGEALWRKASTVFRHATPGALITYEELAESIGIDLTLEGGQQRLWSAAGTAARNLRREGWQVNAIRGQGYRVKPKPPTDDVIKQAREAVILLERSIQEISRTLDNRKDAQ